MVVMVAVVEMTVPKQQREEEINPVMVTPGFLAMYMSVSAVPRMAVVDIAFRTFRRRRRGGERALTMAVEVMEQVEYIVPVHIIPATVEAESPAIRQDNMRGRDTVVCRPVDNTIPFATVSYRPDHDVFPFASAEYVRDSVYGYRSDYVDDPVGSG